MSLDRSQLEKYARERSLVSEKNGESAFLADCDIIEFLLDNCEIEIDERNRFFADVNCREIQYFLAIGERSAKFRRAFADSPLAAGQEALAYTGDVDFGHTSPVWESIMEM